MSRSLPRPKNRISVLVVTADNMTSELLKNAFAHGRQGFTVETLTGTLSEDYRRTGITQSGCRIDQ